MAKASVVPFPTDIKLPELKLPKLDLNALFGAQTATLAAVHQAQIVLADAVQAIAKVQYGYAEQAAAEAKSALTAKELPKPEAVMASLKAAAEKGQSTAKEVVDLAVAAQKQALELLTQRAQANMAELKSIAA